MNIKSINYFNQQNYTNFKMSERTAEKALKYQMKLERKDIVKQNEAISKVVNGAIATLSVSALLSVPQVKKADSDTKNYDTELKKYGITLCELDDDKINISGPNIGYFLLGKNQNIDYNINPKEIAKEIVCIELKYGDNKPFMGGLRNYKKSIDTMGRQDIINKGIGDSKCIIDPNIDFERRVNALKEFCLKLKDTKINIDDLFFTEDEAFYYDKNDDAIYSMILKNKGSSKTIYKCKFILNENNRAIGYKKEYFDVYKNQICEKTYIEQQDPSKELPEYADINDSKMYAECARFGNIEKLPIYLIDSYNNVLNHLHKIGFKNAEINNLQILKTKDKNDRANYNILFYNDNSGRSLVYDSKGKYMYQLEYNHDSEGNIKSCNKWI